MKVTNKQSYKKGKEVNTVKFTRLLSCALFLIGIVGGSATAFSADGVLLKQEAVPGSNYCHMKFPAIRGDTLNWDQPVLENSGSGDIIDFYGSCDESPSGRDQASDQRSTHQARRNMNDAG